MRKALILAVAIAVVFVGVAIFTGTSQHPTGIAFAQVAGTFHDLSAGGPSDASNTTQQVCVFCHHPHVSDASSNNLLWNYDAAAGTFNVYNSTSQSMNGAMQNITMGSSDPAEKRSWLCMSCHDGDLSSDSLIKAPSDTNPPDTSLTTPAMNSGGDLGSSLQDDHPVNVVYANTGASEDTGLSDLIFNTAVLDKYPLYTNGNGDDTVQCATCHDVHAGRPTTDSADAVVEFMRGSTAGSQICMDCHVNK